MRALDESRSVPLRGAVDAATRDIVASFFPAIGPVTVGRLLQTARMRPATAGEVITVAEKADQVGLLVEGMLRTVVSLPDGRSATIHYIRPVAFFGLPTIYFPVPLSVHAITNAVTVAIDAETLRLTIQDSPKLGTFVARQLALAVRRVPAIIEEFGFKTVRQRVAAHLYALSDPDPTSGARIARVNQTTLAEFVGSAREVVWRSLRSLADEGLVKVGHGSIRILDEEGLQRAAGNTAWAAC